MVWHGMAWHDMAWHGMTWHGMVWYGMVWYDMVWYGMAWRGGGVLVAHDAASGAARVNAPAIVRDVGQLTRPTMRV